MNATINKMKNKSNLKLMFRKELMESRKLLLIGLMGFSAFWILVGLWCGYFSLGGNSGEVASYIFIYFIAIQFFCSVSFSFMKRKETRLPMLMIPGTAFDKVFPKYIINIVSAILAFYIGFLLLEGSRLLGAYMFDKPAHDFISPFTLPLLIPDPYSSIWIAMIIGFFLLTVAYFSMGAILWPKYSYLVSIGVLWAIQVLLSLIAIIIPWKFITFSVDSIYIYMKCLAAGEYLLALAFFYLGYLRFRHSKVLTGIFK